MNIRVPPKVTAQSKCAISSAEKGSDVYSVHFKQGKNCLMRNAKEITTNSNVQNICTIFDHVKLKSTFHKNIYTPLYKSMCVYIYTHFYINTFLEQNICRSWTRNGKKSVTEWHIWCNSLKRQQSHVQITDFFTPCLMLTCLLHWRYFSVCIYLQNMFHNLAIRYCKERREKKPKPLPAKLR